MAENTCPRRSEDIQQCIQQTKDSTPHPEKQKLHDIRRSLSNSDHSIWKPIKSRRKPRLQFPPIRKNTTPPGPWAKSDDDKVKLFASHLAEVYTPHSNTPDPEVESILANHTKCLVKTRPLKASELTESSNYYPQPRPQARIILQLK